MKKRILIFLAVLCMSLTGFAIAGEQTQMALSGMTVSIPSLPVSLSHYEETDYNYYGYTSYSYAWKFDCEENTVLSLQYRAYKDGLDYVQYAADNRLMNMEGAEIVEAEDQLCVYCTTTATGTFFLMKTATAGICLSEHGMIAIAYENDALTEEETLAAVKAMIASIQYTEFVVSETQEIMKQAEITTEEELNALLAQCYEEKISELKLTCSETLYNQLSENQFAAINRFCYAAGMKDFRLYYSESRYYIDIDYIEYTDVPAYAWADTLEEAEAAAYTFVEMGVANFNLGCAEEVYNELINNRGMYTVLAKLGIQDFDLYYTSDTLQVQNMKPFASVWAVVDDVYSAADQLVAWREQGLTRFALVFGREVYQALSRDQLQLIDFLGGVDDANSRSYSYGGFISYGDYGDVEWVEGQSVYCPTEEDIVTAIRVLGAQGATSFRIMTTAELYETLNADSFTRLHALEAEAGMSSSNMRYYFGTPIVEYSEAVIVADAVMLTTLEEVNNYVAECVARQDAEINLFLTEEVYGELMKGLSWLQIGKSDAKVFDLIANAGIADYEASYSRDTHIVTLKNVQFYAGTRILQAVQNGTEAALSPRDQETLTTAQSIAAACKASTELETLKNIHDALCIKIVYTDDESTDEDDCAIGAILTGEANCDGYADALYLIGHLAGLDVRYQHGDSVKQGLGSMFATHMWNVVKIDDTWRLVDVTWDDQQDGDPIYAWFNIGEDRASKTHVWSREMTVAMDPITDAAARMDKEYNVTTAEDVTAAIQDAEANGVSVYYLYVTDDSTLEQSDLRAAARDTISGSFYYMWLDGLNCLQIKR